MRREVPLNALVRQALDEWLVHRATIAGAGERALWVSRTGGRLSARSADRAQCSGPCQEPQSSVY